jgi:hypothetical protein
MGRKGQEEVGKGEKAYMEGSIEKGSIDGRVINEEVVCDSAPWRKD